MDGGQEQRTVQEEVSLACTGPGGLSCPSCGSREVELEVRQRAVCTVCRWGGMEFELTGYDNGWSC
ncbi:hypothetical protein ABZZ17_20275 [Streptomyces sp. NPDC006512]|uniref:hypothetical protein n=1 Tax=Streptomyces sp. NPDC006512 TaxID=3154307 RepID=UPI0033B8A403